MSQLSLFAPRRTEPAQRPPDLPFIRKCMHRDIRMLRDAEFMPWSEGEARSREKQFVSLAALLPNDEAQVLIDGMRAELGRLRSGD